MKSVIIPLLSLFFAAQLIAQDTPSPIIFICDGSGSMWGQMEGKSKMTIAKSALSESMGQIPDNQPLGLFAYGHRENGDCADVEMMVDTDKGCKATVNQALTRLDPLGKTPLAYSAMLVLDKLRKSGSSATIILLTDGMESCDGDICADLEAAKHEGIDFKFHIIGFGMQPSETGQLKCAAEAGGGQYFDAGTIAGLGEALSAAIADQVD